jgi:hypothetical protein
MSILKFENILGSIFSDAANTCGQSGTNVFFPSDSIQNAVVKAALAVWVNEHILV